MGCAKAKGGKVGISKLRMGRRLVGRLGVEIVVSLAEKYGWRPAVLEATCGAEDKLRRRRVGMGTDCLGIEILMCCTELTLGFAAWRRLLLRVDKKRFPRT